jgi:shikimate kinase
MNIFFLIGFMGAGKSYWGKRWAQATGLGFVELDSLIESRLGHPITEVFAKQGETFFRQQEAAVLKACTEDNCIVATGGGTACFFDNMEWMNAQGTTVYLQASPQILAGRLVGERAQRPLLQQVGDTELESFIAHKLAERAPFYQRAGLILPVETLNDDSLMSYIETH